MRALLWDGSAVGLVDRPEPTADGEMVVVRVHLAGVCNTDLELIKGYMGFRGVLGHEFVGTVIDGPAAWRGRRVRRVRRRAGGESARGPGPRSRRDGRVHRAAGGGIRDPRSGAGRAWPRGGRAGRRQARPAG